MIKMAIASNVQTNLPSVNMPVNSKKKINNIAQKLENNQANENKVLYHKLSYSCSNAVIEQHSQQSELEKKITVVSTSPHQHYKVKREKERFSLDSFIKKSVKIVKPINEIKRIYNGNSLDSDIPTRSSGKHRETPKKKVYSKLKQDILKHESQGSANDRTVIYVDNEITDDLNQATSKFLKKIVTYQENAYKKDQGKAKVKRRYVLGLHQTKKYFLTKKIQLLIIASDMRIHSSDEVLYKDILNLTDLAKENEIPYVFALKRSNIGNLTKTYRLISCVGILNYQSAEAEVQNILNNLTRTSQEEIKTDDEGVYQELLVKLKDVICDEKT